MALNVLCFVFANRIIKIEAMNKNIKIMICKTSGKNLLKINERAGNNLLLFFQK
jgi:hypothetical protein